MLHETLSPEFAAAVVAVVVGLVGAIRNYRRSGSLSVYDLPVRSIRRLVYEFRKAFFTENRPPTRVNSGVPVSLVRQILAEASYEPEWPLSFHYHGEDLNARRYYYDEAHEYPHRQLHVRAFVNEAGAADIYAHDEPSAIHHPAAHLRDNGMLDVSHAVVAALKPASAGDTFRLEPADLLARRRENGGAA